MQFKSTAIAQTIAELRADAAGQRPATMTEIDFAVRMLELLHARVADEEKNEERLAGAREQAHAQATSIADMVAALTVDYDRLEELRDMRTGYEPSGLRPDWASTNPDEAEELAELEAAAGDCEDEDDARQRINEDPLSVEIRSGWHAPGEGMEPTEFKILLCTGGPAVRIVGELDEHGEPDRAWIEYQDWFTSWTEYHGDGVSQDDLLAYCREFYFGA